MMETALILLAAGNSSRMGAAKQLLSWRGKPLVRHAAETALAAGCNPVIVVVGAHASEVSIALDGLPVEIVENADWAAGMGTSIRTGVCVAERNPVAGLILTLADQPLISSAILRELSAASEREQRPIVASEYAGTVGVPVYFAREHFPALMELKPSEGCKNLILANAPNVFRIPCPEAEMDIDTPADYSAISTYPE